jgi:hypothetical protein
MSLLETTDPTIEALKSLVTNLVTIQRAFSVSSVPLITALLAWASLNLAVLEIVVTVPVPLFGQKTRHVAHTTL